MHMMLAFLNTSIEFYMDISKSYMEKIAGLLRKQTIAKDVVAYSTTYEQTYCITLRTSRYHPFLLLQWFSMWTRYWGKIFHYGAIIIKPYSFRVICRWGLHCSRTFPFTKDKILQPFELMLLIPRQSTF